MTEPIGLHYVVAVRQQLGLKSLEERTGPNNQGRSLMWLDLMLAVGWELQISAGAPRHGHSMHAGLFSLATGFSVLLPSYSTRRKLLVPLHPDWKNRLFLLMEEHQDHTMEQSEEWEIVLQSSLENTDFRNY